MQSVISAEEFQRFQTQLLDLREAQILATEAKLNAEKRVNVLESEVTRLRNALTEAQSIGSSSVLRDLQKDNQLLREKLLSTESAFQLQSSTLHAECHRLTAELGQLREAQINRPKLDVDCQTDNEISVDCTASTPDQSPQSTDQYSIKELDSLRNSLIEADIAYDRISKAVELLETKVVSIESVVSSKILAQQETLAHLSSQKEELETQLRQSNDIINQAGETEKDLRNQLESVKRRSEKLNRELRRQLNRFLRAKTSDPEPGGLHRTSQHSSSSSLSINLNGTGAISTYNGYPSEIDPTSNRVESTKPDDLTSCKSKASFDDLPAGFFSMADFKSLVDRMSEVQEENCTLRRHNQILEAELMAKSQAIQHELNKQLLKPPTSNPTPPTSSALDFGLSWFSSWSKSNPKSTSLSSANLETVNRLKLMCEQLITQNVQLNEKLQAYQGSK